MKPGIPRRKADLVELHASDVSANARAVEIARFAPDAIVSVRARVVRAFQHTLTAYVVCVWRNAAEPTLTRPQDPTMPRNITEDPSSLAYDIIRSVPFDVIDVIGHVLVMRRGSAVMTCECRPHEDVRVSVSVPGGDGWVVTYANDTDTIARAWPE